MSDDLSGDPYQVDICSMTNSGLAPDDYCYDGLAQAYCWLRTKHLSGSGRWVRGYDECKGNEQEPLRPIVQCTYRESPAYRGRHALVTVLDYNSYANARIPFTLTKSRRSTSERLFNEGFYYSKGKRHQARTLLLFCEVRAWHCSTQKARYDAHVWRLMGTIRPIEKGGIFLRR